MTAPIAEMYRFVYGNWHSMIAYVYAELGIADRLLEGPRSAGELARETGTDPAALARVLACAGGMGFHAEEPKGGRLVLSDLGRLLATGVPGSLRAVARLNGAPYRYAPWGRLLDYVRTGSGEGLSPTWESGTLDYLRDRPELLAVFQEAMRSLGKTTASGADEDRRIARALDLGRARRVLDVGGGRGGLCEAMKAERPGLEVALFDLPEVVAGATVPDSIERVAGDFGESVPPGFDLYTMKNVLHNHPRERCLRLLGNVAAAMGAGSRLIVLEMVLPEPGTGGGSSPFLDLNLHLLVGGAERTRAEYAELLGSAGLELVDVLEIPGLERKALEARRAHDPR